MGRQMKATLLDIQQVIKPTGCYKHVSANHPAGTQGNKTNFAGTHDADSDSDCDEQVIIFPSYPSNSIQGTQRIDTPGDRVDDSPFPSADEIFRKELAKLKDQGQRVTFDVEELRTPAGVNTGLPDCIPVSTGRVPVPAGRVPVPPGGITVPTGSLPVDTASVTVPAGDTTVPTDDVQAHSSNLTTQCLMVSLQQDSSVHLILAIMIPRLVFSLLHHMMMNLILLSTMLNHLWKLVR
nr:hypothetical protein [Tanacetum cinerariifolium]